MWKDLSMSERAAFIKLGVDNGVYDMSDAPKPIELEPFTPYSSSDINFSDPGSSLTDAFNMIQMIRRPRKINIYT